jgi:hypothetical protein
MALSSVPVIARFLFEEVYLTASHGGGFADVNETSPSETYNGNFLGIDIAPRLVDARIVAIRR